VDRAQRVNVTCTLAQQRLRFFSAQKVYFLIITANARLCKVRMRRAGERVCRGKCLTCFNSDIEVQCARATKSADLARYRSRKQHKRHKVLCSCRESQEQTKSHADALTFSFFEFATSELPVFAVIKSSKRLCAPRTYASKSSMERCALLTLLRAITCGISTPPWRGPSAWCKDPLRTGIT
jgi:hypothetical protein